VLASIDAALNAPAMSNVRSMNDLAIAWYPGTMRPFESLESVAAKWCLLNRLSAHHFEKWSAELAVRRRARRGAGDVPPPRLDAEGLAKALGEPVAIVRTLRSRQKIEDSNFSATALQLGKPARGIRFCGACLREGFHSDLHEVPWLGYCFVHPEVELTSEVESLVCGDASSIRESDLSFTGRVRFLMRLWGGARPVFPLPAAWHWRRETLKSESSRLASSLLADIAAVTAEDQGNTAADASSLRLPPFVWGSPVESIAPRVRYWSNKQPRWLELVGGSGRSALGMPEGRRIPKRQFPASADEQLLAIDSLCGVEMRVKEVFAADLWPQWRRVYDRVAQALVSGHRGCQAAYDAACRPLMPLLGTRVESVAEGAYIVARIAETGRLACERLNLAATWQGLFVALKGVMPMHRARLNSEAQARLEAQRVALDFQKSIAPARVNPSDEAAFAALLGYHLPAPDAKTPNLADAILLEIVTAASWAIDLLLEQHTVRGPSTNDGITFDSALRILHPTVILTPRADAIELNMTAYVPSRLPEWVGSSGAATDPSHMLVAANDAERIAERLRADF